MNDKNINEDNFQTISEDSLEVQTCSNPQNDKFNDLLNDDSSNSENLQSFVVVEFKGNRREIFLNHNNIDLQKDDKVVVTAETGFDFGKVSFLIQSSEEKIYEKFNKDFIKTIVRLATDKDLDDDFQNKYDEKIIVEKSNLIVQSFGLEMKVTEAEWQLDKQKLTIFFTAPQRVDFRELVKDLARQFKSRIELRQISAREEVKRAGSCLGTCGQKVCCTSFLFDFIPVSVEQAKLQQLSNNVAKLSGNCRRLKCCLAYEYKDYLKEFEKYPPISSTIEFQNKIWILIKVDIFGKIVTLFNHEEKKYETLPYEELEKLVKDGKVKKPVVQVAENHKKSFITAENNDCDIIEDEF
jgi:cell fate regulator YaaT (PSP1 superfamily)